MNPHHRRSLSLTLWLVSSLSLTGCQNLMFLHWNKLDRLPTASAQHPVVEVICIWEQAEGTGLDGLPCRGFAGQLLFFAQGRTPPVRVDGKVRIFVFDDQGTPEEQETPIHQFDFDSKAFQSFLTDTNIGAAYQLFIPYTRKGGQRATCSLRVRLTPAEGNPVYSKMASVVLSGTTTRKPDQPIGQRPVPTNPSIQLASHTDAAPEVLQDAPPAIAMSPKLSAEINNQAAEDRQRLLSKLAEVTRSESPRVRPEATQHPLQSEISPPRPAQADPPRHPLLDE